MSKKDFIKAEIQTIEAMIRQMPEEAIFDRAALQSRIHSLETELTGLASKPILSSRKRLTFSGAPVLGSKAILAEFAGSVSVAFSDLYDKVSANLHGTLRPKGPIPNRRENQLSIVGIATGSFGFEFAAEPEQTVIDDELFEDHSTKCLNYTIGLLDAATNEDDDALVETISTVPKRVLVSLRKFLDVMGKNDSFCTIDNGGKFFKFRNVHEVRKATERISDDNITEDRETHYGSFTGFLPKLRTFEFAVTGTDEVIRGKVSPELEGSEQINLQLGIPTIVEFSTIQIGDGRQKYLLEVIPTWET